MKWASLALVAVAMAATAFVLIWGATGSARIVGGAGVAAAVLAGILWFFALVRTGAENAMHKQIIEERRRAARRDARPPDEPHSDQ